MTIPTKTLCNSMLKNQDTPQLYTLLAKPLHEIEQTIHTSFDYKDLPMLKAVSEHIIGSGGKRIRPLLLTSIAALLGTPHKNIIKTAAALEFIHTATLLHDDVVDKGHIRRGNKTAHLIWGNQASILSGDHMFASAFIILGETENISVIKMMSNATKMLAQGEIIQLSLKQKIPTTENYFDILKHKTAALFAAGCACAAILNQSAQEKIDAAYYFGYHFGIAFQLIDDILDYQGNEQFGKPIGADFFEGKFTLPLIHAYHHASQSDKAFIEEIMLKKIERTPDMLNKIQTILTKFDSIIEARKIARPYIQNAQDNLDILCVDKESPIYQALKTFLLTTLFRKI